MSRPSSGSLFFSQLRRCIAVSLTSGRAFLYSPTLSNYLSIPHTLHRSDSSIEKILFIRSAQCLSLTDSRAHTLSSKVCITFSDWVLLFKWPTDLSSQKSCCLLCCAVGADHCADVTPISRRMCRTVGFTNLSPTQSVPKFKSTTNNPRIDRLNWRLINILFQLLISSKVHEISCKSSDKMFSEKWRLRE